MNDDLRVAMIGLLGAVVGSVITSCAQARLRRKEELRSARERRRERLLDAVTGLLDASDPESETLSYDKVLHHVHHSQLLLDPLEKDELDLSKAISRLAWAVQNYLSVQHHDISGKIDETRSVLHAHAEVTERSRKIVWSGAAGFRLPIS